MSEIEFTQNQTVYGPDGQHYTYHEKAGNDKHYVYEIILIQTTNYHGDDFDEHEEEGQLVIRDKLYAKAPIKCFDQEFEEKREELTKLRNDVTIEGQKLKKVQGDISSHKALLEAELCRYPHHDAMIKLLNVEQPLYRVRDACLKIDNEDTANNNCTFNFRTGAIKTPASLMDEDSGSDWNLFYDKESAAKFYLSQLTKDGDGLSIYSAEIIKRDCELLGISTPYYINNRIDLLKKQESAKKKIELEGKIEALKTQIANLK